MSLNPIQNIFAYNTGSLISGTTQVGDIAIKEADVEYSDNFGGLQWWGGPDQTNGYVIAYPIPSCDRPTPVFGVFACLGFKRSEFLTEPSFLELANSFVGGPPAPFASGNDASTWLTNNGYWNSWVSITPTPTPTLNQTPTPTPTTTQTPTETLTPTNSSTPTPSVTTTVTPTSSPVSVTPTPTSSPAPAGAGWFFYTPEGIIQGPPISSGNTIFLANGVSTFNPNYTGSAMNMFWNISDSAGNSYVTQFQELDTTGGTITMTQGGVSATLSGDSTAFNYNPQYLNLNVNSALQVVQSATTPFVSGSPITLTFNNTPGSTPTPTPSNTATPVTATPTPTVTATPSGTPGPTPTNTPTPDVTPSPTATETPTPTVTPSPTSAPNQIIVAAGGVNAIGYSYDGQVWNSSSNGSTFLTQPASAAASSPTTFVAGGPSGSSQRLIYSYDGNTWSASTNGNTLFNSVNGIAYGGGKFVAVGINTSALAGIAYSTDGITWTASNSVTSIFGSVPTSVAFNGSRWVATAQAGGGANPKNTIAYSNDAITWSASSNSTSIFTGAGRGVAWGSNRWIAVGDGTNRFAYSNDGITWTGSTSGNALITSNGRGVAFNGTQFVACGGGTNTLVYSSDGITWQASANGNTTFSLFGYCVVWDSVNSQWIAGGQGTNQLALSSDGSNWSPATNGNIIMNDRVLALAARN